MRQVRLLPLLLEGGSVSTPFFYADFNGFILEPAINKSIPKLINATFVPRNGKKAGESFQKNKLVKDGMSEKISIE